MITEIRYPFETEHDGELRHLVRGLSSFAGGAWDVKFVHSEYELVTYIVLTKDCAEVHTTKDSEDMLVYMQAIIALEGKQ